MEWRSATTWSMATPSLRLAQVVWHVARSRRLVCIVVQVSRKSMAQRPICGTSVHERLDYTNCRAQPPPFAEPGCARDLDGAYGIARLSVVELGCAQGLVCTTCMPQYMVAEPGHTTNPDCSTCLAQRSFGGARLRRGPCLRCLVVRLATPNLRGK